jgi:hypothetical protein
MRPTVMEVVSIAREDYLNALQSLLREIRSEHQEVFSEIGFEPDNENLSKAFRPMRIDAGFVQDGKVSFVVANLEAPEPFTPIRESWNGLEVELHPFVWNEVTFEVLGASPDEAAVAAWREYWMDDQEKRFDKSKELQGVVHSVTQPTRTLAGWSTTIDFGSADIDAFSAFIDAVRKAGAQRVTVGAAPKEPQNAT